MSDDCIAVAYSGGRDSTALLHATAAAAAPLGMRVVALHVHHGLSAHADAWLAHCEGFCGQLAAGGIDIRFVCVRVASRPARGDSVEAWARTKRYAALRSMACEQGATIVLLAQHRRDQAETWLLQALRGAGPAGLAGMPDEIVREGITWARPWLGRTRQQIDAYVKRHHLAFVDDDSNDNESLARNRLRLAVWPSLLAAFPDAEGSLASAATWAQEAAAGLAELALIDLGTVGERGNIDLAAWRALSAARRSNVLRAWLRGCMGRAAPMSLVVRLMAELEVDRPARWSVPGGELRSHRGRLTHVGTHRASASPIAPASTAPRNGVPLRVTRAGTRLVPAWNGALRFERVTEGGVALDRLRTLVLRPREGREQFQAGASRPPRALKKQFQSRGVSAWERDGPLVYSGDALVFVPGLGIDHRVLAPIGTPQMTMHWEPAN